MTDAVAAIAHRRHLSEHPIKPTTTALFAQLNLSSRTEAAIADARAGLILLEAVHAAVEAKKAS